MLGGIESSLRAVAHFEGFKKVVQIKGRQKDIALEACEAAELHADIIFVDSGQPENLREITDLLIRKSIEFPDAPGYPVSRLRLDVFAQKNERHEHGRGVEVEMKTASKHLNEAVSIG